MTPERFGCNWYWGCRDKTPPPQDDRHCQQESTTLVGWKGAVAGLTLAWESVNSRQSRHSTDRAVCWDEGTPRACYPIKGVLFSDAAQSRWCMPNCNTDWPDSSSKTAPATYPLSSYQYIRRFERVEFRPEHPINGRAWGVQKIKWEAFFQMGCT